MKIYVLIFLLIGYQYSFAQQYDSVFIENKGIDENNNIYKVGNLFVYDYEIIINGEKFKLKTNTGMFSGKNFELTPDDSKNIEVKHIYMLVNSVSKRKRTNKNQTEISYLQYPNSGSYSSTGAVENDKNVWIHPIRNGFFNALETAPFPYVKMPLQIGNQWSDKMQIGEAWGDELWGKWKGKLFLNYKYDIKEKTTLRTPIGDIKCYRIESTAASDAGITTLNSFFSERFGFVRLEYELLNDLKVNMWLVDVQSGKTIKDVMVKNN